MALVVRPGRLVRVASYHLFALDPQVFGVPDAKWGEELCAWVRLRCARMSQAPVQRCPCVLPGPQDLGYIKLAQAAQQCRPCKRRRMAWCMLRLATLAPCHP